MPIKHSVSEVKLKNGATGLIIDVPDSTVVAFRIHFLAGGEFVSDPSKEQAAHIMEHMAFGANKKYPSMEAFSQEFTKNGAYSNASTSDISMIYIAWCAHMEWRRIFDLLELSITSPVYLQETLDAEKGNVREELVNYANNNSRVLWQQIFKSMGSVSLLDSESVETIDKVTLKDIEEHHQNTHSFKNMRFVIAGNVAEAHDYIIQKIESWQLPEGKRLIIPKDYLHSALPVHIEKPDMSNIRFSLEIVLNDRRLTDEEIDAMEALNHILTGTFHSRIFGKARTNGWCYSMGTSCYRIVTNTSHWEFYGQVGEANAENLFHLIADQLKEIASGKLTQKELDEAKQYALGRFETGTQTVHDVASWYDGVYFNWNYVDPIMKVPKQIEAIDLKTISRLVNEFISKGVWTLGNIGSMKKETTNKLNDIISKVLKNEGQS